MSVEKSKKRVTMFKLIMVLALLFFGCAHKEIKKEVCPSSDCMDSIGYRLETEIQKAKQSEGAEICKEITDGEMSGWYCVKYSTMKPSRMRDRSSFE